MNKIKVYNSLTQKLEEFIPWDPPRVKMYCCGPTVYDLLHVGNFRGAVFYNFLRNFLEHEGYEVTFVYNFTDVDDKIINRARSESVTSEQISQRFIEEFWRDFNQLKLRPHSANPRVTDTIPEIINFVEGLIQKGMAYVTSDGDVYFAISQFPEYGKLSHRRVEELETGVRIEVNEKKRNPLDFALWKSSSGDEPRWKSPWGEGRPGWHIECSAMIHKHLGAPIDIHGGGMDLIFPHHENEIAQSEGLLAKPFVKYWVHNNLIQLKGSKMSKSLGNIITARDFFNQYHPEIYKFMVLSVHYRSVLDLGDEAIARSIRLLSKIYSALAWAEEVLHSQQADKDEHKQNQEFAALSHQTWQAVLEAGRHDFNSALMISHGYELIKSFNQKYRRGMKIHHEMISASRVLLDFYKKLGNLLSLFLEPPSQFLKNLDDHLLQEMGLNRQDIQNKVDRRSQLRKERRFQEADLLRSELNGCGIQVHDLPDGTSYWEVDKST
ncbi:MAG: cysteine--tRNA ligase [Bdellovibrionaceae bacterium]|nr:cysteine--tRNA ligase [Pseudobdellovibrionaceae bacterium]MDW8190470.1 cysteine--tRNA ligase [Pseudobdellovibrionaceae bacterium]